MSWLELRKLKKQLKAPNWRERLDAVTQLNATGNPKAIPLLIEALKDGHQDVQDAACQAIRRVAADAVLNLTQAAQQGDRRFRAEVVRLLGHGLPGLIVRLATSDLRQEYPNQSMGFQMTILALTEEPWKAIRRAAYSKNPDPTLREAGQEAAARVTPFLALVKVVVKLLQAPLSERRALLRELGENPDPALFLRTVSRRTGAHGDDLVGRRGLEECGGAGFGKRRGPQ